MSKLLQLLNTYYEKEDAIDYPNNIMDIDERITLVQNFLDVEQQILSLPGILQELTHMTERLSHMQIQSAPPIGYPDDYTTMWAACTLLSRSGLPGSAEFMLNHIKKTGHENTGSLSNFLPLLKSTPESFDVVKQEVDALLKEQNPNIYYFYVITETLVKQRSEEAIPLIRAYIDRDYDYFRSIGILKRLVQEMPDYGLALAKELENDPRGAIRVTAHGLRAVYCADEESYAKLLAFQPENEEEYIAKIIFVGGIIRPESFDTLIKDLTADLTHASSEVRSYIIHYLIKFENSRALQALLPYMYDDSLNVAEEAVCHIDCFMNEIIPGLRNNFYYETEYMLSDASLKVLEAEAKKYIPTMDCTKRYEGKRLYTIDDLYEMICRENGDYWYIWVSTTGFYQPIDTVMKFLYNYQSHIKIRDWFEENKSRFEPGAFYYHGKKIEFTD